MPSKNKSSNKRKRDDDCNNVYEVECIVDHKIVNGVTSYKVRWVGYGAESDEWIQEVDVGTEAIDEYNTKNKKKVTRRSITKVQHNSGLNPIPQPGNCPLENINREYLLLQKIKNLEQRLNEVETTLKQLSNNRISNSDKLFNIYSISDKYQRLSSYEKQYYIGGDTMIGVKYEFKDNDDNVKTKTMCIFYKSGECKSCKVINCTSRRKNIKVSNVAEKIHLNLLANLENRNMSIKDVGNIFRKYMACVKCVTELPIDGNFMFNYHKKSAMCVVCKILTASSNIGDNKLCGPCNKYAGLGNEGLLSAAFKPLVFMFKESLETNYQTNVTVTNDNQERRYIDLLLTCNYNGKKSYIMIEKDENQHNSYSKDDELAKINLHIDGLGKSNNNNEKENIIIIRYSSIGNYDGSNKYDKHWYRLLILRQWVILYLLSILDNTQPNNIIMIYMWYTAFDTFERSETFRKKFKKNMKIFQINNAPNPGAGAWKYAFDPSEMKIPIINDNAIDIQDVVSNWH